MKKAFKLFTLVCAVVAMFAMTSCKKSQEDLIVGTWKMTAVALQPDNGYGSLLVGSTFVFNADKTMSMHASVMGYEVEEKGTYAIKDGKLVMTTTDEDGVTTSDESEIKTLDKKNLVLYVEENDEEEGLTKMTLTLERQ